MALPCYAAVGKITHRLLSCKLNYRWLPFPPAFLRLHLIIFLALGLLGLGGCAEVTKPTPTGPQIEAAQLDAARRHPYQSWSGDRVSRVFLRLMPWLPVTQGRTYPFLGFNWWVTATGQVAVDQVWYPSPAREAGLRRGDVIVAVNNWPLPTWVEDWDKVIATTRCIFQDFSLTGRRARPAAHPTPAAPINMPFPMCSPANSWPPSCWT